MEEQEMNNEGEFQKSEFRINSLVINDDSQLNLEANDIVVVTGTNNVGKSQLLRDIKEKLQNAGANTIVLKDVGVQKSGDGRWLHKYCKLGRDGMYHFFNNSFNDLSFVDDRWKRDERYFFIRFFLKYLNTEERLHSANNSSSYSRLNQQPSTPIQMLYADDKLEEKISAMFRQAFGTDIMVNRGGGNEIPFHIGERPEMKKGEDRIAEGYVLRMAERPLVQDQGDGMRSFAGILLNVYTGHYSTILIDEPEAFLHPPQAFLMGKMLAENESGQLIISTHSEDFLQGILSTHNPNVKIVRLTRDDKVNHISVLNNDEVKQLWSDPLLRHSKVLSGIFHEKVVICEADTDCRFYQAVSEVLEKKTRGNVLFTHCGGKQRIPMVVKALRALNVNVCAITDIDVLNDKTTFFNMTEAFDIEWASIEGEWKVVFENVKQSRAQLDKDDVAKKISEILEKVTTSQMPQDALEEIRATVKKATAWSKVKEAGESFFMGEPHKALESIIDTCKKAGLFIVPVGELECFYRNESGHGTKWVLNVLENVDLEHDEHLQAARKFVQDVVS